MRPFFSLSRVTASIGLVLLVTFLYRALLPVNPTTVALTYVIAILLVASRWGVFEAMAASVTATVCLNVFFLPPVGTVTIADPHNWIALLAFLLTGIVASQLSGRARRRHVEVLARQRDLERLYALSRGLLLSPGKISVPSAIAEQIAAAFERPSVGIFDQRTNTVSWTGAGQAAAVDQRLRQVADDGVAWHEGPLRVVPIRLMDAPIGSLAIAGSDLGGTVLQSIASLVAIGLERARSLEAAAQAEAAQLSGELRAMMLDALAHEFKTPLTSMKVAAAGLRGRVPEERDRELAAVIDEDLDRLQSLVNDTVQMVRVDSGNFTLRPDRHLLSDTVAATLGRFRQRLDGHVVVNRVPASMLVHADGDLLGLALRQLLDNAIKYSPANSLIEIGATGGETIDIAVRNSGSPIPEQEQTRLFERFYRGSGTRRIPGSGMGLAIVRQIAEAHGGRVTVSSSASGGTEVKMSLPTGGAC